MSISGKGQVWVNFPRFVELMIPSGSPREKMMMGRKEKEKKLLNSEQRLELHVGTVWKTVPWERLAGEAARALGTRWFHIWGLSKAGGVARVQKKGAGGSWGFLAALGATEGPSGDSGAEKGTGLRLALSLAPLQAALIQMGLEQIEISMDCAKLLTRPGKSVPWHRRSFH